VRATEAADTPQMCGTHYCAVMYCCQQLLYLNESHEFIGTTTITLVSCFSYGWPLNFLCVGRSDDAWLRVLSPNIAEYCKLRETQKWNFKLPPTVRAGEYWIGISSLSLAI